ncbi:MAG: nucleotidyltransferase domain-containing protein [Desulfobacterales bacterium]|nr:nucleotidyltransferase domain-containing protein [Desulfobacterales bacterium]
MDKSQVIAKATEYALLVSKNIKPQKVVLYGSSTRGSWREESDIDIAVIVKTVDGDFLDMETLLYKLRRNIDDRIEPVLLEENCDESGFLSDVLKHGHVVYSI